MTVTHTHYIIDYASGVAISGLIIFLSEKLSYYLDVKVRGLRANKRWQFFHSPCPRCGWSNRKPCRLIGEVEKKAQAQVCGLEKGHSVAKAWSKKDD